MSTKLPEKRQVVRFAFYKLDSAWRRLSAERQASAKLEFGETIESFAGRLLLRPYGLVGIRGDCDFLLWQVAEDLDSLVALQTALNRTDLGAYLAVPYSYLAMTRRSIYEFPEAPGAGQPSRLVIRPSDARYLFVYPFIKTRGWYLLPKPERQVMMDEHVRIGRQYPSIRLNTTYSYGLDDQEFIVAFEGDNPADFLDLVMELRESKASSYTLRDMPTFTCVQMSLWDMLDTLAGAGSAQAVSRRPTRAAGRTPVARCAGLSARARRPLPAGIPRVAAEALAARAVPQAGVSGPGHLAADRAPGCGRGDSVRRHPAAVRAAGAGPHVLRGRGPADHPPRARGGPGAGAGAGGPRHRPRLRTGGGAARGAGTAPPCPAHRLRRRAVHAGELRDRGRCHAQLRPHQAVHVLGAARVAPAARAARGAGRCLSGRPGRRRGARAAAVRQLGGMSLPGRLRELCVPSQPAGARAGGRVGRAGDPFRDRYRGIARGLRPGGGRRDRRRLARPPGRGVGADRPGLHSGEPRSRGAARPPRGARAPDAGGPRPRGLEARTHLQPGPRRASRDAGRGAPGGGGVGAWRLRRRPSPSSSWRTADRTAWTTSSPICLTCAAAGR